MMTAKLTCNVHPVVLSDCHQRCPMPAPPSDHYKPSTLTAWTAARRAAAARLFRIKQAAAIEEQASREEKEEAESKSKEGSSRPKRPKPHEVHAANLVDDFVRPLLQ